jgi:hypothetical protein
MYRKLNRFNALSKLICDNKNRKKETFAFAAAKELSFFFWQNWKGPIDQANMAWKDGILLNKSKLRYAFDDLFNNIMFFNMFDQCQMVK